jgi:hypothetical protein
MPKELVKCEDCSTILRLYENCTTTTMKENICSDCYIIRRNQDILKRVHKEP